MSDFKDQHLWCLGFYGSAPLVPWILRISTFGAPNFTDQHHWCSGFYQSAPLCLKLVLIVKILVLICKILP
jgi:hypothetical protein